MTEIEVCEGVKTIGNYAFYYSIKNSQGNVIIETAKEIVLPSGLVTIGNCAFENCFDLEKIDLPETVTDIGYRAFEHWERLKELTIPEG